MAARDENCLRELERLERVFISSINAIYETITLIEKRLERIERMLKTGQTLQPRTASDQRIGYRDKERVRAGQDILEDVDRKGFALASTLYLSKGVKPKKLLALARARGYKVIDLSGDYLIVSLPAIAELENRLSTVDTVDHNVASKAAGEMAELFELLRSRGRAYYDGRKKRWVIDLS